MMSPTSHVKLYSYTVKGILSRLASGGGVEGFSSKLFLWKLISSFEKLGGNFSNIKRTHKKLIKMCFLDQPSFQNNKIRIIVIDQEIKEKRNCLEEIKWGYAISENYLRFQLIHKNTLIECKTLNSKEMFKLVNFYNLLAGDIVFLCKKGKVIRHDAHALAT